MTQNQIVIHLNIIIQLLPDRKIQDHTFCRKVNTQCIWDSGGIIQQKYMVKAMKIKSTIYLKTLRS